MSRIRAAVVAALALGAGSAQANPIYAYQDGSGRLIGFSSRLPGTLSSDLAVTGVTAGEVLVGLDFRPQNGLLYGLGVNAAANTASLYAISIRTGVATPVGVASGIAYVDAMGAPIDLPDPASSGYGVDFNPVVDRVRVVTDSGLNLRINPNNGVAVDGDALAAGVQPDGAINGGTTAVSGTAYSNNQPNTTVTSQYTLDSATDSLFLQNPPNNGGQTQGLVVTSGGNPLDFTGVNGFDIPPGVNAANSNTLVPAGSAFAGLTVAGETQLWRIDLPSAEATALGRIGSGATPAQGLAVQHQLPGLPMIGLQSNGATLVRFSSTTPGTTTTVALTSVAAGEVMVGIDWRPQTGQLMGLAVNALTDTGSVYVIDPQTGAATAVGTAGQVAFTTDGATAVDLPDPVTSGYGFDFNPTVDRIRVTSSSGLNFRLNPNNGAPVDGNNGGAAGSVVGTNPDGAINGAATGAGAAAYTNSFGQSLTGGVTTLYTLDASTNQLMIQNPPNAGGQASPLAVTLSGAPLDFTDASGFDIPASVAVSTSNAAAVGQGYAVLTVGGTPGLYAINLSNGTAISLGTLLNGLSGLAIADQPLALFGDGFE
jgi:hypothetical protein